MKRQIIHLLFIASIIMAFPFHTFGSEKEIDFNFPQDVSKNALSDLDKALKASNGEQTVDALVRYSLAQSGISMENMSDIIEHIETVIEGEKQSHIKALLYHLEAQIYLGYRDNYAPYDRNNPVEETPTDVSEWDRKQFDKKITELVEKSLAQPDALKAVAVTSLPDIIKCNKLGATYVPTLYEFLLMKSLEMTQQIDFNDDSLAERIKADWIATTEGNVPAHMYVLSRTKTIIPLETFRQYQDNEYSALLLYHIPRESDKEYYKTLQEYVKRFPNSIFTPEVKNTITDMENKYVHISYPEVRSSHDSIPVIAQVKNANSFNIEVYQIPKQEFKKNLYHIDRSKLKFVSKHPVKVQGRVPFNVNDVITTLPPLPYGAYVIYPEIDAEKTADPDTRRIDILHVTDIASFTICRHDHKDLIAAVDIHTGKPLPGVTILEEKNSGMTSLGTTDADGTLAIPLRTDDRGRTINYGRLTAINGNDQHGLPIYASIVSNRSYDYNSAEIYTDLGVYRPGETIHWAAIAYNTEDNGRCVLVHSTIEATFLDSNNELIDTVTLTTDAYGRIEGTFVVPKDRMNGTFVIRLKEKRKTNRDLASHCVSVSEYKTPTFEITFPDARRSYVAGQPVKVTGKAMTYSGLPVQNSEVRLSLVQYEWSWSWWWWRMRSNGGEHLMDTTVITDEQGNFTFEFPVEMFKENNGYKPGKRFYWARCNYEVVATLTTDAGETHEESTSFIVGTRRGIELGIENNNIYFNDKPIKLPLKYNTTDEEHPDTWCTWEVTPIDAKVPVLTGNFNSADPTIDMTSLPSGQYTVKIHILDAEEGEQDVDVSRVITLYRKSDKTSPVKDCPLWLTPLQQSVDKNNKGHITIGVSTPHAYIYYVASTVDDVISQGWLDYDKGMHDFTVQLPKEAGKNVTVTFITHYGTKLWRETVTLQNPYKAEALKITATSFRDKLVPGDMEHWTFSLTDQNGKPHRGAMLLDMFDKAIASIQSNDWTFSNWSPGHRTVSTSTNSLDHSSSTWANWSGKSIDIPEDAYPMLPVLYTYGQNFFGYGFSRGIVVTGYQKVDKRLFTSAAPATEDREFALSETANVAAMKMDDGIKTQDELMETEAAFGQEVNEKNLEKVTLRESDVKTALWQPMLTSDEQGNISLEFEVPNFNTTWITQAVAWDDKMVGSQWMAEVLTQKPLMVRSNMPRFLRQGDKATLAATVQNATEEATMCDAVIELFDPRTNDVFATRKFNLQLDPNGSQAVTIDWQVPDTIAFAGFRIKAANSTFGDGEQVMIPVLTTISPVIETHPFYVEAGQGHFEQTLPNFPADARVTLEYCDNPVWYCVLALPTIFSDSYCIATHVAHNLFALQVAQGVAKSQPQIKEAVAYWKEHNEDSTLVSMLKKNQDLKIGTLLASPWIRDAERQTLRMSKLNELFDEDITKKEYEKIISALQSLQMDDGGFTWFRYPGCKSEPRTTGTVLELIGEIKHLGYLPEDSRLTSMINRALSYYDNETVKLYNKILKDYKEPYGLFTDYAYIRTLFPEVKQSSASASLFKKVLKYMDKNWSKGLTLKQKAYYAMTLYRNNYANSAHSIIESIRQFAIVKPELGMYWDNLQTGYGWWERDKVVYTSTILKAMNEVEPRTDEIDLIRKWMLLMKQSNDWGTSSLAADAVYSILSSGSQWIERSTTPTITVAGQNIELDKMAQWLGYFRTTLPATTTGNVVIDRTGSGPAWGAVYSQFSAPMTQIEEVAITEMSISKEYYVYAQDGSLHQATSFKVGDKVKVRVIIKTNKDMDFVTITDERAACFEPIDQLSGYRSEDNTWFYQETKDTQTNVFFNSLKKGTHIIGYDVWVTNPGEFTSGIATIQCQYAPQLSAHSAGKSILATGK